MCGIAGIVTTAPTLLDRDLVALAATIEHRGPDDVGFLQWGDGAAVRCGQVPDSQPANVGLAFRRLAILDLTESGRQPMASHGPGRNVHVVYNGEIYNFVELRQELRALGHEFRSTGDTEVLVAALQQWGMAALRRFVGMFALALFDPESRVVHLARDPFGIKPLYYATWAGGLAFASEIKALLELPQVSRRADPQGVYDYLYQGLVDHDEHTMFADVRQLPPGSYVSVAVATARPGPVQRYWQPQPLERTSLSFRGAVDELRELFLDSIRLHLRSDVPVGAALSGGVDSSSIVAAMRQVAGADLDLRTFSFVADEEAIDESRWANLVAEAAGAQRHLVHVETDEFIRDLDHLIRVQDQPFASTSIYAQHRVMQAARASGVTVMLDGQGADELFAGYRVYARNRVHGQLRRGKVSAAVRLARSTAALPGGESANKALVGAAVPGQVRATRQLLRNARAGLKERDAWFVDNHVAWSVSMRPRDLRKLLVDHVTTSSLPALLRYEDRNSMAFSIESRVPFLTVPLAEFAMSMPDEYLVDDEGRGKAVLREAMRGITPDPILDRRDKIGFATPEASWLTAIRPWITTAMASDARRRIPLAWAAGEGAVPFGDPRLWRWVNLVRWTEIFEVEYA